ncbi:MAG: hypothetical protein KatS3mg121_0262 [Gammaproteobacteria bacterium]|nr:MAG: hypothetical protein KatS3mg121_0262 [Gammaproteobacteria bacterium]
MPGHLRSYGVPWADLLSDHVSSPRRTVPPKQAVGDGALGFWAALGEAYPKTRHQRCWVHKTANVLNYLPRGAQPKAKKALQDIWMAQDRASAEKAFVHLVETYRAKYPKAMDCLRRDREALQASYDFPAEHWVHIRTTNPTGSAFATIRHRTDRAKGCVSRNTMLAMLYKPGMSAEKRLHWIRGFHHPAKVIEGAKFRDGVEVNHETDNSRNTAWSGHTPDLTIALRRTKNTNRHRQANSAHERGDGLSATLKITQQSCL